ncbi:hypothetical protein AVEN_246587-1 [Araneus ventricosus]|uniref:Uncharacterized protein n=1 Tax=Araneus ventricosus TaxID=182803 RepID=A0A4Y2DCC7_ARAVE|nr:hypothetical protein AVEN_246587-1 [Araneus ventricosus]
MMDKFGKIVSCDYHLCYPHAIHLAVWDVLYNKRVDLGESTVEIENISYEKEGEDESEELTEDLGKALDLEFEGGIARGGIFNIDYAEKNSMTNINRTIKKIRGIV